MLHPPKKHSQHHSERRCNRWKHGWNSHHSGRKQENAAESKKKQSTPNLARLSKLEAETHMHVF